MLSKEWRCVDRITLISAYSIHTHIQHSHWSKYVLGMYIDSPTRHLLYAAWTFPHASLSFSSHSQHIPYSAHPMQKCTDMHVLHLI